MRKQVKIYDCTLREGSQASGISFSVQDKLRITQLFDDIGFAYTEGGWPDSNSKDVLYFENVKKLDLKHIKVVGFGRTRRINVKTEDDANLNSLIQTGMACGHIVGKGWDFHVHEVLRVSPQQNLDAIHDSVRYLKRHMEEVSFGFEHFFDAYKGNHEYTMQVLHAAIDAGVDWIDLADTNGGCFPDEVARIVTAITAEFKTPFAVHCHNDTGCGVANTVVAVQHGVTIVEGTVNGYSERCGMADLCTVIANLQLKLGYRCIPDENVKHLTRLSENVADLLQSEPLRFHPYVGSLAFTHKGGVHVDAFLKNPRTYEHIDPALVGNRSNVAVSDVSGKGNLEFFFRKHGLGDLLSAIDIRELVGLVKDLELIGYEFNAVEESLLLVVLKEVKKFTPHIDLKTASLSFHNEPRSSTSSSPSAKASDGSVQLTRQCWRSLETDTVTLDAVMDFFVDGKTIADQALSMTLTDQDTSFSSIIGNLLEECRHFFPELTGTTLVEYKVRAIDHSVGSPYHIRVILRFRDARGSWSMLGLGRNVVSATLNATIDAFEYRLNLSEIAKRAAEAAP